MLLPSWRAYPMHGADSMPRPRLRSYLVGAMVRALVDKTPWFWSNSSLYHLTASMLLV